MVMNLSACFPVIFYSISCLSASVIVKGYSIRYPLCQRERWTRALAGVILCVFLVLFIFIVEFWDMVPRCLPFLCHDYREEADDSDCDWNWDWDWDWHILDVYLQLITVDYA